MSGVPDNAYDDPPATTSAIRPDKSYTFGGGIELQVWRASDLTHIRTVNAHETMVQLILCSDNSRYLTAPCYGGNNGPW